MNPVEIQMQTALRNARTKALAYATMQQHAHLQKCSEIKNDKIINFVVHRSQGVETMIWTSEKPTLIPWEALFDNFSVKRDGKQPRPGQLQTLGGFAKRFGAYDGPEITSEDMASFVINNLEFFRGAPRRAAPQVLAIRPGQVNLFAAA